MVVLSSSMSAVIKLGSRSSLAHITTRNMKADLAREDWKLLTLKHDMNYVKRKDRLLLNQHINHTFPPPCSPEKTKSAFEVPTTLNLQGGKKSLLCAESSFSESCSSNYRHCLPKPSAVAFITPGRAAGRAGAGEEETQVSQQPQPGCTGKLWHWSDPHRSSCPAYPDLLQLAGAAGLHVAEGTVGSAPFSHQRKLGDHPQVTLSKPRLARPQ